MHYKRADELVADYWEREISFAERAIATAQRQLGKIANEHQLRIDYTPALEDNVVHVDFRPPPVEDICA